MLRIPLLTILICSIFTLSYAQDSVKKASPVKSNPLKPSLVTPTSKVKAYKYRSYKYKTRTDSAGVKPALQQPVPVKPDSSSPSVVVDKSLNGQYQYLLTKIYRYQQPLIGALWKSASDTLNSNRRKLLAVTSKIDAQTKIIDSLKTALTNKDQTLNASITHLDVIDVLGISIPKHVYNLVMWGLVLLFGITAAIVIARSAGYRREAKYRTELYNEMEEEFKTYKAKANEKEKKLARELQTERNKLDELLGRG
ncbi:MAG: hypothetical protein JWQ84_1481 [Mucilaginibacter sp.]|jgi:hypothetical protein|nr:hypothetical protein [Mucilaginibacter sp.]